MHLKAFTGYEKNIKPLFSTHLGGIFDLVALVGDAAEADFLELGEPFPKNKIIVGCIYRPPYSNIHSLLTFTQCLVRL